MSARPPKLSIIVADDGRNLEGVLESLAAQRDESLEVIVEAGADFGEALERGFLRARGAIVGCLDADDRLIAGTSCRIAARIAPERQAWVAMGRAAWIVDGIDDVLVAHPSEYVGIADHLRIWSKGFNTVPRASFFWHRSVRERVGPFLRGAAYAVDYDFTCRVGKRFRIHGVDDLWSVSRMPAQVPAGPTEQEMLRNLIAISRRHWGGAWSPVRWRCALSLATHERHWPERARHHARRRERALSEGRRGAAALELAATWLYSPAMARGRFLGR